MILDIAAGESFAFDFYLNNLATPKKNHDLRLGRKTLLWRYVGGWVSILLSKNQWRVVLEISFLLMDKAASTTLTWNSSFCLKGYGTLLGS